MALLAVAGSAVVYMADPASVWLPKCPFHAITGLDCPTCGSTRALHAMLHGDIARGLAFNPMAPVLWSLALAIVAVCLRSPRRSSSTLVRVLVAAYILIYLGWGIVRNIAV